MPQARAPSTFTTLSSKNTASGAVAPSSARAISKKSRSGLMAPIRYEATTRSTFSKRP